MKIVNDENGFDWVSAPNKKVNSNLYEVLTDLPAPEKRFNLSKDQKFWYRYFGLQLISSNKLTKPDLVHLHRMARIVDYIVQAEQKIEQSGYEGGLVQTFKNGTTNISGHVTIREKYVREFDELSKHFGFSFRDRAKIQEPEKGDPAQGNLFEQFLKATS